MSKKQVLLKLDNYKNAVAKLEEILNVKDENDYILDATIKRFEFTYELSWKLIKSFLEYNGIEAKSPRGYFKEAFAMGLIKDEIAWTDMIEDRNTTSLTYNADDANEICMKIKDKHFKNLQALLFIIEGEISK